jgi:hypothetical protein
LREADRLDARRQDLDALAIAITSAQRLRGAGRIAWPQQIFAALQPELRAAPRLPSKVSTPAGAEQVQH